MELSARVADDFSAAMLANDIGALGPLLADDVVLYSPIAESFRFAGREDVLVVLDAVREVIDDLAYAPHLAADDGVVLNFRCRIGAQELEGVDLMRLDGDGRVRETTVFIRPLAGITTLAAALGPVLARRRARWRGVAIAMLAGPLALVTRRSDRLGGRIAGRELDPR